MIDYMKTISYRINDNFKKEPNISKLHTIEDQLTYSDLTNLWKYFRQNNQTYKDNYAITPDESVEIYKPYFYKYGYILSPLFNTLISKDTFMIVFYIKGSDESLIFYKSNELWDKVCDSAFNDGDRIAAMKYLYKGPFWIINMAYPSIKDRFYSVMDKYEIYSENSCVGIICYE